MLSGGVRVNPLGYSSECAIQLGPLSVCYAHNLTRIASPPHVLLFRFPLDRQCLLYTTCGCQSDCWIEFVQVRDGRIFRAHCGKQQSFPCLGFTTCSACHCMPPLLAPLWSTLARSTMAPKSN